MGTARLSRVGVRFKWWGTRVAGVGSIVGRKGSSVRCGDGDDDVGGGDAMVAETIVEGRLVQIGKDRLKEKVKKICAPRGHILTACFLLENVFTSRYAVGYLFLGPSRAATITITFERIIALPESFALFHTFLQSGEKIVIR